MTIFYLTLSCCRASISTLGLPLYWLNFPVAQTVRHIHLEYQQLGYSKARPSYPDWIRLTQVEEDAFGECLGLDYYATGFPILGAGLVGSLRDGVSRGG